MIYENAPIPLNIPEGVPLYRDERGAIRVGTSRVLLDIVIGAHTLGYNAAEIAQQYPTVSAADITAALDYYRNNKGAVDEYLRLRRKRADKVKAHIESQPEYVQWKKRLLERAQEKGLL